MVTELSPSTFSGIVEDLTKDVEGASLTERLLATPHKFYVTPKDVARLSIFSDTNHVSLLWSDILIVFDFTLILILVTVIS